MYYNNQFLACHCVRVCTSLLFSQQTSGKYFIIFCHFTSSKVVVKRVKELYQRHTLSEWQNLHSVVCFTQGPGLWITILYMPPSPQNSPVVTYVLHSPPGKTVTSLFICLIQHLNPMLLWDFYPWWISTVFLFFELS